MTCPHYIELYHSEPDRCLDPEAEYERYRTDDDTSEARAERRGLRLQHRFTELTSFHARQARRWQPKDILED